MPSSVPQECKQISSVAGSKCQASSLVRASHYRLAIFQRSRPKNMGPLEALYQPSNPIVSLQSGNPDLHHPAPFDAASQSIDSLTHTPYQVWYVWWFW